MHAVVQEVYIAPPPDPRDEPLSALTKEDQGGPDQYGLAVIVGRPTGVVGLGLSPLSSRALVLPHVHRLQLHAGFKRAALIGSSSRERLSPHTLTRRAPLHYCPPPLQATPLASGPSCSRPSTSQQYPCSSCRHTARATQYQKVTDASTQQHAAQRVAPAATPGIP